MPSGRGKETMPQDLPEDTRVWDGLHRVTQL